MLFLYINLSINPPYGGLKINIVVPLSLLLDNKKEVEPNHSKKKEVRKMKENNKKIDKEKIKKWILENPEPIRSWLSSLEEAIKAYQYMGEGLFDTVIYRGLQISKEGGEAMLEAYGMMETDPQRREELQKLKTYWTENYDSIRRKVYHAE